MSQPPKKKQKTRGAGDPRVMFTLTVIAPWLTR